MIVDAHLGSAQLERLPGSPTPALTVATPHGVTVAADVWGPDVGRPVVLLHGGGQTRHAWRAIGPRLGTAGCQAFAVDLRGHGDTSWAPDGDYSYDRYVDDLTAVVAALALDRPALVGASLGGSIALVAAADGATDASALVLVDSAPQLEARGVADLGAFMTGRPDGYASLEEIADEVARFTGRDRPPSIAGLRKNVRVDRSGRYHWHWDRRFMGTERSDAVTRQERLEACARKVAVPTLLVRGARSDLLSEDGAKAFLELCPHSEYVSIAGASHMVVNDRNDRFADAVVEFLARRLATGT